MQLAGHTLHELHELFRQRHSSRVAYDPDRPVTEPELEKVLEAARWAPTAHNMQNFEIVAVDDKATLAAIGAIRTEISEIFLRENYLQLSFSEEELVHKKTGVLASMFPPSWRVADAKPAHEDAEHAFLGGSLRHCRMLLIVLTNSRKRAPASEGDVLGFMSLGCVMQNMWLAAESIGLGFQILSALAAPNVESELRALLRFPDHMKVAFACRLGHPVAAPGHYLRVRRAVGDFTHRNRFREHG